MFLFWIFDGKYYSSASWLNNNYNSSDLFWTILCVHKKKWNNINAPQNLNTKPGACALLLELERKFFRFLYSFIEGSVCIWWTLFLCWCFEVYIFFLWFFWTKLVLWKIEFNFELHRVENICLHFGISICIWRAY